MKFGEIPPISTKKVILEKSSQGRTPHEGLLIKRNTFSTFPEAHPDARLRSFRVFARENWKSTLKTWKSPFSLRFHKNSFFRHPKQVKSINLDKLFLAQIHASRQGCQNVPKTLKIRKSMKCHENTIIQGNNCENWEFPLQTGQSAPLPIYHRKSW